MRSPQRALRGLDWQAQHEAGATAGVVFAMHGAAVASGDGLDQRQAQSDAAVTLGGTGQAIKGLKDALSHCLRHAWPAVADANLGKVPVAPAREGISRKD